MKHLRRLWPYVRRQRGRYSLGVLLVALSTLAWAGVPVAIQKAVSGLEHGASERFILGCAAAIALLALARGFLVFSGRLVLLTTSRHIEYELRNDLYGHLLRLPASFYDRRASGDISSRAINDLESVRMMLGFGIMSIAGTGLMFVISITGMFLYSWQLSLLCLIPLLLVIGTTALLSSVMESRSLAVQDQLGVLSTRAQENFTGARVIRAFAQEERETERYRRECETYLRRNMSLTNARGGAFGLITLFTELAIVIALYVGGRGLISGTLDMGAFTAFTAYLFMLAWPVIAIGWTITMVQRGAACMGRISEILDMPPAPPGGKAEVDFAGRIEIRNLTFRYEEGREPALRNVSLTIEPGQKVAIVGRTGSGKSTIAALLTRLYPAPPGTVFIDGRDVNDIPAERQRRAVGCVPQDPFLFSDTLRENVAFGGRDGAADVDGAAALSRIAEDARRFPDRMEQMIGERGVTLSGGQKQRTAIARAIVRQPAILILDDALSSVDSHTERAILDDLRGFMKGRTSIVITHRLASASDADRIVVLERGEAVESGTHEELLARGGAYARMWNVQQLMAELGADEEAQEEAEKTDLESRISNPGRPPA